MEYKKYNKFVVNKYFNWYSNIIERAISENRVYDSEIHEYHHALPHSLGGTETVILSFKEHYICHWLLTKFTTGTDRHKMIMAMSFFYYLKINTSAKRPMNAIKSTTYANYKKIFVEAQKEKFSDPTINPFYKDDVFTFKNISSGEIFEYTRYEAALKTGMRPSEVSRLIYRAGKGHRKSSSKGWSIWVDGLNKFSDEIEKNENNSHRYILKHCDICGKYVDKANFKRWHGENCKSIV